MILAHVLVWTYLSTVAFSHETTCPEHEIAGKVAIAADCFASMGGYKLSQIPANEQLYLRLNFYRMPKQDDGLILVFYPGSQSELEQTVTVLETRMIGESNWQEIEVPLPGFDVNHPHPIVAWIPTKDDTNLANRLSRFTDQRIYGQTPDSKLIPDFQRDSYGSGKIYLQEYENLWISGIEFISRPKPKYLDESQMLNHVRHNALTSGQVLFYIARLSPMILAGLSLILLLLSCKRFSYQSALLICIPLVFSSALFLYPIAEWTHEIDKIRLQGLLSRLQNQLTELNKCKEDALRAIESEIPKLFDSILESTPELKPVQKFSEEVQKSQLSLERLEKITDPQLLQNQLEMELNHTATFCEKQPDNMFCRGLKLPNSTVYSTINPDVRQKIRELIMIRSPLASKIGELETKHGLAFRITNGSEFYHSKVFGSGIHYKLGFVYVFLQVIHLRLKQDPNWIEHVKTIRKFVYDGGGDLAYIDAYLNQPDRFQISGAEEKDAGFRYHYLWTYKSKGQQTWIASITLRPQRLLTELANLASQRYKDLVGFSGSMVTLNHPLRQEANSSHLEMLDLARFHNDPTYLVFYDKDGCIWPVYTRQLDWFDETKAVASLNLHQEFWNILIGDLLVLILLLLTVLGIVILNMVSARRITAFLSQIVSSAQQISAGNYAFRLQQKDSGDFAFITGQWNRLTQSLQEKQNLMEFLSSSSQQRIVSQNNLSQRQFVSVLFAAHPEGEEKLIAVLEFLHKQIEIRGGWIDKFTGTAILSVFEGGDCALNASLCALELASLQNLAVGVASGELVLGQVGSKYRKDYTVIGDTVNMAARLEAWVIAKGSGVCIDSHTYSEIKTHKIASEFTHNCIRLKGKREEQHVYASIA